eukprot:g1668.t1
MIGSLAQGLVGVIVDEVAAQGGRRIQQQRDGVAPYQQQHQYQQQRQQQQRQQLPPGPLASLVESITLLFNRAVAAIVAGLQYLLLFEALLLSAVVIYGALYWLVMPLRLHDKPVFFDYSNRATAGGATGVVDFLAQHTQWDPSPLTKVERLNTKVLKAGQHYKVGLELQMPTSYTNRRVGVFMVHMTLLDDEDNELATSARPAMLPHTSALRKGVGMLFSWPLHVLGLRKEAETVLVDCVDFYEENALHPLTKARITVSSGRVQFYRSSIHITPQLKGLPWLMQHWFYSTLAAGVLFIASVELMLFGFCYVFFFIGVEATNTGEAQDGGGGQAVSLPQGGNGGSRRLAGGARSYGGAGGTGVGGGGNRGGSRPLAETAVPASAGRGVVQQDDEGLRRRRAASAATTAGTTPSADSGDTSRTRGVSSASVPPAVWATESPAVWATTTTTTPSPSPSRKQGAPSTLPPGVQAYQRGARYVVQPRGSGGRPIARPDVGGPSGVGVGAGPGDAGRGGSGSSAVDPRGESASQEEVDAAAMASWAALDGNVTDMLRRVGEGVGGGGRGVIAPGVRVVDPVPAAEECEPHGAGAGAGAGTAAVYVEGEGAGDEKDGAGGGVARGREEGGGAGRRGVGSSPGGRDDDDNW